ncbi:unnamed protein product [Ectocarpus sp. CCAP 1310/34]|nr:unnamed protein product [Ectocarpus sp. CCAP 1310/34]
MPSLAMGIAAFQQVAGAGTTSGGGQGGGPDPGVSAAAMPSLAMDVPAFPQAAGAGITRGEGGRGGPGVVCHGEDAKPWRGSFGPPGWRHRHCCGFRPSTHERDIHVGGLRRTASLPEQRTSRWGGSSFARSRVLGFRRDKFLRAGEFPAIKTEWRSSGRRKPRPASAFDASICSIFGPGAIAPKKESGRIEQEDHLDGQER